jgi:O-antigen/teichoic acid export membrane protein
VSRTPSTGRLYVFGAGATFVGRGIEVVAGFAIVWLLTQVLAAEGYGRLLVALTLMELIAQLAAGGLEAVVVYRSSRSDAPPGQLDSGRVAGAALGWGLLGSGAVAAGVWLLADPLAALFDDPEAARWIRLLAPLIPLQVGRAIYAGWHRARQRVPQSMLLGFALPRLATALGLAAVWWWAPAPAAIAAALIAAPLLVLGSWFASAPLNPARLRGGLARWDVGYAVKMGLNRVLAQGVTHADILMLGLLSTPLTTGHYGVASRLALLTQMVFTMLSPTFASRVGYLYGGRREQLVREYDQTRGVALLGALLVATALAFFGAPLLRLFGDFETARPTLWILAAAWLGQASFGMNRSYLGLAGHGGWTLAVSSLLLLSNVGLNLLLIPRLGGEGAALASLLSILGVRALTAAVVWRLERFPSYSLELALLAGAAIGLLLAGAAGWLGPGWVGAGLLGVLLLFAGRRHREWSAQLSQVLAELRRPSEAR